MPSQVHETLTELFRHRPVLTAELLADHFGISLPAYQQARVDSSELTDLTPAELRADAVVTLLDTTVPAMAVVVEVQLRRDRAKRFSWPTYVANLRSRLRCPVALLVVCVDRATAAWCAAPIELGPGSVITPLTLGPDRVPVVTDPATATGSPELAVLSAMAHGSASQAEKVFHALLAALDVVDPAHATLYAGAVLAALPETARLHLEALMTTSTAGYRDYLSPFVNRYVDQGRREGEARGEARAVLTVLAARGVRVPDDARDRILAATDLDQLDLWVRRAVTAQAVEELFD